MLTAVGTGATHQLWIWKVWVFERGAERPCTLSFFCLLRKRQVTDDDDNAEVNAEEKRRSGIVCRFWDKQKRLVRCASVVVGSTKPKWTDEEQDRAVAALDKGKACTDVCKLAGAGERILLHQSTVCWRPHPVSLAGRV